MNRMSWLLVVPLACLATLSVPSGCVEFDTYNVRDGGAGAMSSSSTSGGGEGGMGGTGGMGGAGGMPPTCTVPQDCPMAVTPACRTNTQCVDGYCLWVDLPEGTPVPGVAQTYGDCITNACDGFGRSNENFTDAKDKYDWGNDCYADTCGLTPIASDTSTICQTSWGPLGHCNGNFKCIACAGDGECNGDFCVSGKCVPMHCKNSMPDAANGETGVDCGGPCAPCPAGGACNASTDCEQDGECLNMKCQAPDCGDFIKNGDETDVDCGGTCVPMKMKTCLTGKKCLLPTDCTSGSCVKGSCL